MGSFRHSGVARASASRPSRVTPRPRPTRPRHDARADPRNLETLAARRREISPRAPASAARAISASSARFAPWTSAGWGRRHRARLRSTTPSRRYVRRRRAPAPGRTRARRTPRHRRSVRQQTKKKTHIDAPSRKKLGSDPPQPPRARSRDRCTTASPRPRTTGSSTASLISAPRRNPTTS